MLKRSFARLSSGTNGRYDAWPWANKLPLKAQWFKKLSRTQSLAQNTRGVLVLGDLAVVSVVVWAAYRLATLHCTGAQQTGLRHLNNHPPAIIAQDFDFQDGANNRTVSRKELDAYRAEYAEKHAAGASITSFIFNY